MPVEDVFSRNQGRVVMATGRIERGRVRKGDLLAVVGFGGHDIAVVADIIDLHRASIDEAGAAMNVGLVLRGVAADALQRGQVLATPGLVGPRVGFTADIALLFEEENSTPVLSGERFCFYTRAADVWGVITLPHGIDSVQPPGEVALTVVLDQPIALEEGQFFAFSRRGRAAGTGTVSGLLR